MRFPTWKEVESDPEFQSLDTAKKKDYFGKWSRTAVDRAMQQGLYRDEEFASGFTGWYNQKAKEYGDEEEFADFGQLSKRKLKPEVGVFEGIANAAQNAFASSQQAIKTVGGVTPEEAKEISKLEFEKKAREVSPDYKAYQDAEGMDAVKAFITNPFEVTTNIVAEGLSGSLPALGTGLAAGAVGAAIGAPTGIGAPVGFLGGQVAGTFAGSLATEYGGKMLEELQNAGMDINNPDSITEFFSNQKLVDEAKDKALKRGVPVAAFDALSAGIGGKVAKITKAAFKTPVREVAAETAIQAALGGGGEVAGSLAAGEEIRPKDVFAEIVGEVGPGAAEIAIGKVQQGFAERRKQRQLQEAAKVASNLENNNAPLTAQAVTVTSAKDALQQEKQTNEQTETELAQEREKFAPKTTVYEVPAKEEFKTTFAKMSPESIAQTEQGFREELESEDADTRAFAQAGLDALAEFRAGVAPTPITVPPVEEVAPAVAAVTQPAAPAAPVTPAAPEEPVAAPAEPITSADAQVINNLRSVAENTANREQISALSAAGLVDIIKGQPVINEDGEALLAKAQAPLPRLTPEERVAEIQAAPPAPAAEAPAIVEQEPTISEKPPTSEIVSPAPAQPAPAQAVAPVAPATAPTIGEKPPTSPMIGAEPTQPAPAEGVEPAPNWDLYSEELRDNLESFSPARDTGKTNYDLMDAADRFVEFAKKDTSGKPLSKLVSDFEKADYDVTTSQVKKIRTSIKALEESGISPIVTPAPAPVTEQVAPAEVPAPEVAPVEVSTITEDKKQFVVEKVKTSTEDTGAYHYGDVGIGRDTTLQRMGIGRSTGHFGTGVYFLGKKDSQVMADRPVNNIDLSGLNLAQPRTAAKNLHEGLKGINKSILNGEKISFNQPSDSGSKALNKIYISLIGQAKEADVKKAIQNVENIFANKQNDGLRTPSTYVMQELGFDGIDVRGTDADNTEYGSVIFANPTPTPAVSETITEPAAAPAQPTGIAVGNRIKLGKSPQTYTIQEVIPQTATERDLGEQYYSVRNERTGETQVVEKNDVKPVKAKGARRMAATRVSLWEAPAQEIPSAATSINAERLPETFKRVKFESGTINADIGGGRFDNATEALAERGVDNVIYDPFNRPREWNDAAASRISGGKADTATVNSVLNVIKEPENRERVIMQAADAVKQDGKAYFLIHEGDSSGNSRITKQKDGVAQSWQEHRKAETYIPEISKHFGKVERRGNLIIASEPKKIGLVSDIRQQREEVTPSQEDNRYTYEQILVAAKKFFGGKAPANLTIVNDSTDPDYRFKAGYNLETGQIILNQAYLSKEDNIADNIAHELGHFVYGDPEVQAAFKEFWNALSPEQQAQADDIIRRHYSEESQSVQMEENQVRAFGTLIAENRIAPKWERFVNAVKAVLNRLVGTKFRLTDRGAQAVLSSAIKRFQSGERIIREMDAGILSERRGVDDVRYAELEARAKAGDKEAEAEAQRMVDEAAKSAGENQSSASFTKLGGWITPSGRWINTGLYSHFDAIPDELNKYHGFLAFYKLGFVRAAVVDDSLVLEGYPLSQTQKKEAKSTAIEKGLKFNDKTTEAFSRTPKNKIKTADPFTYDDAGNLIPLSERFQPTSPDIRMMAAEAEPTVEPAAEAPQRKPRPTTIQRLIEATTGVKRRRDLLTINEKTALKDQLKLGAKKRRLDAAQQKEFVKDLTAQLREEAIRGRVKAPQLRAIVNKAMQVRFDNDASILSFLNYANKVIDNANYDRDLSDARKAIKSAKRLAKQKDVPAPAQGILKRFANINPSDIDNPGDFALVLNEYMKGYGPVTAEDYVVVPDVEMEAYLDDPEVGLLKQSEDAKAERDQMALINSLNAELGKEGLTEEEKNDILNMSEEDFSKMIQQRKADTQNEKRVARAEAIEKAINDIAANSQIALVNYQNPEMTADQKRILDLVKQVELDQLDVGSRKEYIRIANSILVNNGFFGSQKFASKVLGQLGAKAAAKDSKQTKRYNAMFKFLEGMIGERISKSINLSVQSIADTFRNIAGKDGAPKLLVQMGMGELAKGQAIANKMNAQISDAIRGVFEKIEKETGLKISERRGSFAMGVAGNLLQIDPSETEAQGIQRIRNLIEQDIAIKEKSPSREDRESAVFVKRALDEVYADSVEGILANLKAAHPAHYEALVFLKDEILPEYKPLLKEHDELFNNQTDNYENVNYLPIRYRGIDFEIKAPEDLIQRQFRDVTEPKQSPNTIKRKKLTTLPPGRVFDYNLTRNVINALSDQITAANTNPAWQQIISFLASPDAAEAVGGVENLDFIKQRLGGLARARARTYATTGAERIADAFANLTRRFGIGLALGGYGQFFKQFPSQTATTLANVKDAGLLAESTRDLLEGKAQGILSQFSIGERGEIAGGTKWINQMEGNFGKVRKFYEEGRWAEFSDAFERLNNMWLFALKKSDYLAAGAGWLAYYRKHLKDKGIEFTGWENETNLVSQNDPSRMEAAVYAEQMIDMYQGSSDPTKMAELSQRGQNGYENLFKAIFMPFFSFVLQERSRILSDTRDIAFGDANQKAQGAAGMGGTIAGMLIFHTMRRFLLPAVAAGGASAIYALLGVDMDEPDEEKQQEEANKIWRRFSAEVFSNIVVGGFGSLAENRFVDAVNYSFYIIESQIENENVLDDKGEVMSFDKYQKERSPFYRYTGMGADSSFGMLDIMPGQISELRKRLEELTSEELAETLTPEERRVLYVAGFSELIYTMRLNDTDVARMIRQMNRDVIEQSKEREKAEKRLQNLYK